MKCPTCLTIMYNKDQIHNLDPEGYSVRMSLHCWNLECPARLFGYTPHMSVIVNPNEKWICQEYHFPFQYKNKWFAMVGEPFQGYLGYPPRSVKPGPLPEKQTTIYEIIKNLSFSMGGSYGFINYRNVQDKKGELLTAPFIPIDSGDNMHEQAEQLFKRLIKLAVFS